MDLDQVQAALALRLLYGSVRFPENGRDCRVLAVMTRNQPALGYARHAF